MRHTDVEPPGAVTTERITVTVHGGGSISGTVRTPHDQPLVGAVTIHPATAVAERLYVGFAEHLAHRGFGVVTYDYRGTGASGSPRDHRSLRMRDWMNTDVPAVAAWSRDRFDDVPHVAIGHSVGGQALSLNNGTDGLVGFAAIASHAGVVARIPDRVERARVRMLLRYVGPTFARTLGYVPGRRFGLGENLPASAMHEWNSWSRRPDYFFDDETMNAAARAAEVRGDVLAVGFTDDAWATPDQIDVLTRHLVNARVEHRIYSPRDVGVPAIGHMGFFRRSMQGPLWPLVTDWISQRVADASEPDARGGS